MNREFVPYEEAIALKELGFDEECLGWSLPENKDMVISFCDKYSKQSKNKKIQRPLYQQAFRWFREKGIYGDLTTDLSDNLEDRVFVYYIYSGTGCYFVDRSEEYETYEIAELACLKELIEIVKQNKDDE